MNTEEDPAAQVRLALAMVYAYSHDDRAGLAQLEREALADRAATGRTVRALIELVLGVLREHGVDSDEWLRGFMLDMAEEESNPD